MQREPLCNLEVLGETEKKLTNVESPKLLKYKLGSSLVSYFKGEDSNFLVNQHLESWYFKWVPASTYGLNWKCVTNTDIRLVATPTSNIFKKLSCYYTQFLFSHSLKSFIFFFSFHLSSFRRSPIILSVTTKQTKSQPTYIMYLVLAWTTSKTPILPRADFTCSQQCTAVRI